MTPLTRRDVLAHQTAVPLPTLRQVEQDLILCCAMAALFNDQFLHTQIVGQVDLEVVENRPACGGKTQPWRFLKEVAKSLSKALPTPEQAIGRSGRFR